MPFE
jgi:hypothetical protein